MEKSPDAFRTISEVAETLETPAHVLRFWESRFPQIRPVKRAGGRRYYRPADVALLAGIKRLLHDEGMTIRGVQKILREQGVRHVAGALDGAAVVDAYDLLGLVEAAAQADRDDAEAKVIDLAARVRTTATLAEDAIDGHEADMPAAVKFLDTSPTLGEAWPDHGAESPVVSMAEAEPMPSADTAAEHPAAAVLDEPDGGAAPALLPDPAPAEPVAAPLPPDIAYPDQMAPGGWLPTRLRALPQGGLNDHAATIAPLAARLADLRNRMAQTARPGHG